MKILPTQRLFYQHYWSEDELVVFSVAVPKDLDASESKKNHKIYLVGRYELLIEESVSKGHNPYKLVDDFLIKGFYGTFQPGPFKDPISLAEFLVDCDHFVSWYATLEENEGGDGFEISEHELMDCYENSEIEHIIRLLQESL